MHQQQTSQQKNNQSPPLSDIETSSGHPPGIVQTLEHRRFVEFCDACRRYRYIGLCYGSPGVGKTLSARYHSGWDKICEQFHLDTSDGSMLNTVFYTPPVVNSPSTIAAHIHRRRADLTLLAMEPLLRERTERLDYIRQRDEAHRRKFIAAADGLKGEPFSQLQPTFAEVAGEFAVKERAVPDPTTLIVIDEADRLRIASLEQVRAIFDASEIGIILIGMPGLEKRLARYPQLYSRVGFVHEFRPLGTREVRQLLEQHWVPPGVKLPEKPLDPETVAAIIRITGGNFRLLNRLLTQIERILEINALKEVTKTAVEAARASLVIGQV